MPALSVRRKILYSATALTVATLLCLPPTGWVARRQLLPWMYPHHISQAAANRAAEGVPRDVALQLARALPTADTDLSRLQALNERYPHQRLILACLLEAMTRQGAHIQRAETATVSNRPYPGGGSLVTALTAPAAWARFDAVAADGEASDPGNAFFPAARACAAFAAGRDAEAVADWNRAADKPRWETYEQAVVKARIRMKQAISGASEIGFSERSGILSPDWEPETLDFGGAARLVTARAAAAELRGDAETGWALRDSTRRLGETMSRRALLFTDTMRGYRLVVTAELRPGGAPPTVPPNTARGAARREAIATRQAAFDTYLRRTGHANQAAAFDADVARGEEAHWYLFDASNSYVAFGTVTRSLLYDWAGDLLLLTGAAFSLLLAAVFALAYRLSPRLQRGEPLQPSACWGVCAALGITSLGVGARLGVINGVLSAETAAYVAAVLGVAATVVPPVVRRFGARQVAHGLLVMGGTFATIAACFGVALAGARVFGDMFIGTSPNDWINFGALAAVPAAVLLVALALLSVVMRVPVAAGVTRGARALLLPLACLFLLGWSACLIATANRERAALGELRHMDEIGETQTYAELLGKGKGNR